MDDMLKLHFIGMALIGLPFMFFKPPVAGSILVALGIGILVVDKWLGVG